MYEKQPYPYTQAGLAIRPSRKKEEKVDVFKEGEYICSIRAYGMKDYPTNLKIEAKNTREKEEDFTVCDIKRMFCRILFFENFMIKLDPLDKI